jgi:hypothetical protein
MARFIKTGPCPKCREKGQDSRGDNLIMYTDGGAHCFACGYHVNPSIAVRLLKRFNKGDDENDKEKATLPIDFTREVPGECWKWLFQYGLPYSYWKDYCGYSPKENRLIITHGNPTRFSIGRGFTMGTSKWKLYGDGHAWCETIGKRLSDKIVLVEDIISAHKVGQVCETLCLFGTDVHNVAIKKLIERNKPVVLWLDRDQQQYLPKKVAKLNTFLQQKVTCLSTMLDPKEYRLDTIKGLI